MIDTSTIDDVQHLADSQERNQNTFEVSHKGFIVRNYWDGQNYIITTSDESYLKSKEQKEVGYRSWRRGWLSAALELIDEILEDESFTK